MSVSGEALKYVSGRRRNEPLDLELIPGLPSELVLELILSKVSWQQLATLSSVSQGWRSIIRSRAVYHARIRTDSAQNLVAVLHRVPAASCASASLACPAEKEVFTYIADEERASEEASEVFSAFDDDFVFTLDEDEERTLPEAFSYALSLHDPSDNTWQQLPPIPAVGCGIPLFAELACLKGKLFVIGGRDQETWEPHREVYVLDLVAGNGVWQQCASMITARASFACGVIGDKVYVAGGHSDISCALSICEVYDPERDVWEVVADMHGPRSCCTVAVWEKNMYVIGGYTLSGEIEDLAQLDDPQDVAYWANSAEVYDACKGEWTQLGNMKNEYDEQACTVYNGELYSFSTIGVEKFDRATNSWTQLYKDSWFISHGDGSAPCLILSVAPVGDEIFAMVCVGDECDRGCTLLKSKDFGRCGPRLCWERVNCPVKFVGAFPALCAIQV